MRRGPRIEVLTPMPWLLPNERGLAPVIEVSLEELRKMYPSAEESKLARTVKSEGRTAGNAVDSR